MHLPYQIPALVLAASLGLGCSSGKSAADKHFDALKSEISRLQSDQDRFLERLEGLEAKADKAEKGEKADASGERPPLKVVVLQPEGDPSGEQTDQDEAEGDDAPRTLVRAQRDDDKGSKKAKKDGGKPEADAERDYQEALSLVKKKQHRRSVEVMTAFLVRYPANPRAESVMFWMGESYQGLGDTEKALEQFEAVVARFPQGAKTPDALLKLALLYKKRGADEKARSMLSRLKSDFPQSDAAKRAPKE